MAYRRLQCIIFCFLPVADGCTMASAVLNLVLLHHEGWSPCWRGAGSPAAPPVLLLPGTCCHQTDGNFGPLSLMPCIRGAVCSAVCRVYFTAVVVGILDWAALLWASWGVVDWWSSTGASWPSVTGNLSWSHAQQSGSMSGWSSALKGKHPPGCEHIKSKGFDITDGLC